MKAFGADRGYALFDALRAAAKRGVKMRIVLGTLNDPMNSTEILELAQFPNVEARSWDPTLWYGGGIMHMKVWIGDERVAYLGSANADWKSLAQVKELGVTHGTSATGAAAPAGCPTADPLVTEVAKLFDVFWAWSDPARAASTVTQYSPEYLVDLTLPPWDPQYAKHTATPFAGDGFASAYSLESPFPLGSGTGYVSASPDGALTGVRTRDEDALVSTLRDAQATASLSVMDFKPASAYSGGHGGAPVHWPSLTNAILALAYARPVKVRLLVSKWAHTDEDQPVAMQRLAAGLASCAASATARRRNASGARGGVEVFVGGTWAQACAGTIEVRQYMVPGWNATESADAGAGAWRDARGVMARRRPQHAAPTTATWPAFTRVNHAKYIVTDRRVNIGTSNWQWGYFHSTAGASLNTNDAALVASAQSVFDADWNSPYAVPLV
jgi:phospholipase D3/4